MSFGRKMARKASETSVTHVAGLVLPIFPVAQGTGQKCSGKLCSDSSHSY